MYNFTQFIRPIWPLDRLKLHEFDSLSANTGVIVLLRCAQKFCTPRLGRFVQRYTMVFSRGKHINENRENRYESPVGLWILDIPTALTDVSRIIIHKSQARTSRLNGITYETVVE